MPPCGIGHFRLGCLAPKRLRGGGGWGVLTVSQRSVYKSDRRSCGICSREALSTARGIAMLVSDIAIPLTGIVSLGERVLIQPARLWCFWTTVRILLLLVTRFKPPLNF